MNAYCARCGDEYDPVEYRPAPVDPDEPRFCSDDCQERYEEMDEQDRLDTEFSEIYNEDRYGGAPIF